MEEERESGRYRYRQRVGDTEREKTRRRENLTEREGGIEIEKDREA